MNCQLRNVAIVVATHIPLVESVVRLGVVPARLFNNTRINLFKSHDQIAVAVSNTNTIVKSESGFFMHPKTYFSNFLFCDPRSVYWKEFDAPKSIWSSMRFIWGEYWESSWISDECTGIRFEINVVQRKTTTLNRFNLSIGINFDGNWFSPIVAHTVKFSHLSFSIPRSNNKLTKLQNIEFLEFSYIELF